LGKWIVPVHEIRYSSYKSGMENMSKELETIAREQAGKASQRFADLKPEVWQTIQERFSPPEKEEAGTTPRPRTANSSASIPC
jgi:hypothetical protein